MKLSFFVTLAHVLLLILFGMKGKTPEKKIPPKIVVNIKEEKVVLKDKASPKESKKSTPSKPLVEAEPYEEIAELEPLTMDALPVIESLPEREPIMTEEIKIPTKPKPKPVEKKKEAVKPKPTEKKKIETKPTPPKPKAASTTQKKPATTSPKPVAKAPAAKKPDEKLLKMMKDGLSKMDNLPNSISSKGSGKSSNSGGSLTGSKIAKLQSESLETMTSKEITYAEELAMHIKHNLHFPDEGTMKVKLTLSEKGKVESISILSSSSSKNKEIAQQKISSINFPAFGTRFPNEKTKTFTLQLNID